MEETGNSDKLSLEWPVDSKSSSVAHSEGQKRTPGWPGVRVQDSTLKTKKLGTCDS